LATTETLFDVRMALMLVLFTKKVKAILKIFVSYARLRILTSDSLLSISGMFLVISSSVK